MATQTITGTSLTYGHRKRHAAFDESETDFDDENVPLSFAEKRKRPRVSLPSTLQPVHVADLGSPSPEAAIPDDRPRIELPRTSQPSKHERTNEFIDFIDRSEKPPHQFLIVLNHLSDHYKDKMTKLALIDQHDWYGPKLWVNWEQYGRLMKLKLVKEVEQFPDKFLQVMAQADKMGEGGHIDV